MTYKDPVTHCLTMLVSSVLVNVMIEGIRVDVPKVSRIPIFRVGKYYLSSIYVHSNMGCQEITG